MNMFESTSHTVAGGETRQTALHSLHLERGGKLVEFAGYSLPLHYSGGIKAEHLHTRARTSLFDVSHMGQLLVSGESAGKALEELVTGDMQDLAPYQQRYTLLTNDSGGIIDDVMVTRCPEGLRLVVNAAQKESVLHYLDSRLSSHQVTLQSGHSLLALQGPDAAAVLENHVAGVSQLDFMQGGKFQLGAQEYFINRCGYTGEDGFEISLSNEQAEILVALLLDDERVALAGLGARDSLRLEAAFCLYGKDINENRTPIEANLSWAIAAKYRSGATVPRFPGASLIMQQWQNGAAEKLAGLQVRGKVPVRDGCRILGKDGERVGVVTSGGFSPSLSSPVALGYVKSEYSVPGTELQVEIRNRFHTILVKDIPFIKHRYHNR